MSLHDELLRSARSILLQNVSTTDRLIRNLYIRAARSLAGKISSAKKGSLTERWLIAYKRELDLEIARMNADIERAIVAGARNAARARAEAEAEWLRAVAARAEVDDSFVSVLANVPTDALRAMYDGKLYTDGRMLSRRIWDATGRLEGNIAEIIQQGVAQKMDALTLARSLEAYVNPKAACPVSWHKLYPDIPFDRRVDYSALRLARTSISHVYWAADKAAAKKNPLCTGLKWHLSDSHYERQVAVAGEDVCDAYARHDEGLGTGVYPVDLIPFPHPQCLCYRTEVLPTLEESAEMLGKWVRGEAASPEMDASFEKWRRENAEELERLNLPDGFGGRSMQDMLRMELDKTSDSDTMESGFERRLKNTGTFSGLKVPMELRTVRQILKDMELDYSGTKIRIDRISEFIGKPLFGYTYPDGKTVVLYPTAFTDLEQLCETLAHEHCHLLQISEGRIPISSTEVESIEAEAESFALEWWSKNKERMLGRYEATGWQ